MNTQPCQTLYLDLLKSCLLNSIYKNDKCTDAQRQNGLYIYSEVAHTMIGQKRLNNLQQCIFNVLKDNIPGDFIETGVWRGGATIFMRGMLKAYGITDRTVWVADSFQGLPHPSITGYKQDIGDKHYENKDLAISLEQVKENFTRYNLLDNKVQFLKGWFKDTLSVAPIQKLSILRLDGDMYSSTMDALIALYPKLSIGGYIIVDDYGAVPGCKQAVTDYRAKHNITEPIEQIDWTGVFWKKTK